MPSPASNQERPIHPLPFLTVEYINQFIFSSWYELFKSHSLKAEIISPLSDEFIQYLQEDSVYVPTQGMAQNMGQYEDISDVESDESDEEETNAPAFPELGDRISEIIQALGGAVFPKLNWSSPRDASWIACGNTLKCTCVSDIFLLLKSSDFVVHDLCHAYDECVDVSPDEKPSPPHFELVLKEWYDLDVSMQFRCFVIQNKLVGISQRDTTQYFSFLDEMMDELEDAILDLYDDYIDGTFPCSTYTFDVYVRKASMRPFLMDFNPFGPMTDAYLFSWEELIPLFQRHTSHPTRDEDAETVDFRVIKSHEETADKGHMPFGHNRLPMDVIDMSNGTEIAQFVSRFTSGLDEALKDSDEDSNYEDAEK